MDTPLISVIVPVYKVENYLDRCVQSIVDQSYRNLEIILVDDGSPDNCGAMCDAWAEKDARIKVIHKENGGLSDARNAGLAVAAGEWIVFIDSDDIVSIYLIEALLSKPLRKDILHLVSFSRFHHIPPEDTPAYSLMYTSAEIASVRSGYYCWGALYNREVIRNAHLIFDTNLRNLEDVAWNAIYLLYVHRICFISTPMYYYRHNSTSITSACIDHKKQARAWIAALHSILKWFNRFDSSIQYKKEIRSIFRLCQNNYIAECVCGNLSYTDYRDFAINRSHDIQSLLLRIVPAEFLALHFLPHLYFSCYILLMKIRNIIVARRK